MAKSSKSSPIRMYREAQLRVDATPTKDGGFEKILYLRFATVDHDRGKKTDGTTPWVLFNLAMVDGLALQLASLAESLKHWEPGSAFEPAGSNLGVALLDKPHDG
ncbi:hypothetical protein [Roseateles sp. P5_E7]